MYLFFQFNQAHTVKQGLIPKGSILGQACLFALNLAKKGNYFDNFRVKLN